MTKTFTRNDFIRFLYGEMKQQEAEEFQQILKENPELREELNQYEYLINQLEASLVEPSKKVIEKIKSFSRQAMKAEKI